MKDFYQSAFYGVVKETQESSGYTLPVDIESYVVMLLADHLDKPNFLPETTFAESYLRLKNSRDAKALGDSCLFVTGVFPDYGIDQEYYIGSGTKLIPQYIMEWNKDLFKDLSKHFKFLRYFMISRLLGYFCLSLATNKQSACIVCIILSISLSLALTLPYFISLSLSDISLIESILSQNSDILCNIFLP